MGRRVLEVAALLAQTPLGTAGGLPKQQAPLGAGLRSRWTVCSERQPAGFSFAASALISSKSLSSPPAMLTSVTYLPLMTTVGVLVMR